MELRSYVVDVVATARCRDTEALARWAKARPSRRAQGGAAASTLHERLVVAAPDRRAAEREACDQLSATAAAEHLQLACVAASARPQVVRAGAPVGAIAAPAEPAAA